jgi:hypothetical protein
MLNLGANESAQLGNLTLAGLESSSGATLTMNNNSAVQTGTAAGNMIRFQAYDTNDSSYTEMFRMVAGETPFVTFNGGINLLYGLSPILSADNTQTVTNKTLGANCVFGGAGGLTISGSALTSGPTYGSISLTCPDTIGGTLTISDIGGEDHIAKMTFGELLFTGANIASTGSNRDIGISATGTGVIYLKSPVASIAVSNDAEFNEVDRDFRGCRQSKGRGPGSLRLRPATRWRRVPRSAGA